MATDDFNTYLDNCYSLPPPTDHLLEYESEEEEVLYEDDGSIPLEKPDSLYISLL